MKVGLIVVETALVGTSVTPLFARAPLALAAAAADVQAMAGGRFVLGVGSSTRRMNQDWYGTPLLHPAPQVIERVELIRRLIAHRSGPFSSDGRFERVRMAHYDRTALPDSMPILAAGVGTPPPRSASTPPPRDTTRCSPMTNELSLIEIAASWAS
jgi:alkanesulfonate monooxygenase SsuD/methylene tetrahydromethanopterin reductase-like flavin-dependent oxidoreductase (luciferase family)